MDHTWCCCDPFSNREAIASKHEAKTVDCGNDTATESDKKRRFPQRLGKVTRKSSVTFPHFHSHYCWINRCLEQKPRPDISLATKTGHFHLLPTCLEITVAGNHRTSSFANNMAGNQWSVIRNHWSVLIGLLSTVYFTVVSIAAVAICRWRIR
jgi:hypothetical protein